MSEQAFLWLIRRLRPREGWLALLFLVIVVSAAAWSVTAARWVPEDDVVGAVTAPALLLTLLLAQRRTPVWLAWTLLLGWGAALVILDLSDAVPWSTLVVDSGASAAHIRRNLLLFGVRVNGWLRAVLAGQSSRETMVFALALGLSWWLMTVLATWSAFRTHRPLRGLTWLGLALGVNIYFSRTTVWPALAFIGAATLLTALIHYVDWVESWERRQVDYSPEIKIDILSAAVLVSLFMVLVAGVLPAIPYGRLAQAFARSPAVAETEASLERAFAGVNPPGRSLAGGTGVLVGAPVIPRAFLVGNAPELSQTPVFEANVRLPEGPDLPQVLHWRLAAFDRYTGLGWSRGRVSEQPWPAEAFIEGPELATAVTIRQSVSWSAPTDSAVWPIVGQPLQYSRPVTLTWQSPADLVAVAGRGAAFSALSRLARATPADLRAVDLAETPEWLLERYTTLPPDLPARVGDLARQVASGQPTAYDQARALERFLRQYPYSLTDTRLPPEGRDLVDFFLFDLKVGYCDYYASAMVIMARSLGLPARLAVGYNRQPAGPEGIQTVVALNAHSWAEIYFAGYGWVEFEPTATFPVAGEPTTARPADDEYQVPAIPVDSPSWLARYWPVLALGGLLAGLLLGLRWRTGRPAAPDRTGLAFGRLQRRARELGLATPSSQTPREFDAVLRPHLDALWRHMTGGRSGWLWRRNLAGRQSLLALVQQLAELHNQQQYGRHKPRPEAAEVLWQSLSGPLRRLRWWYWLRRGQEKKNE